MSLNCVYTVQAVKLVVMNFFEKQLVSSRNSQLTTYVTIGGIFKIWLVTVFLELGIKKDLIGGWLLCKSRLTTNSLKFEKHKFITSGWPL